MSDLPHPPYGSTARLSLDGVYRYELGRRWGKGPAICWLMLNPSTADATTDDPTIRRCMGFTKLWGAGAITVVNLFAYRTPAPMDLPRVADPVGPGNDDAIHDAVVRARVVVAAWGASASHYPLVAKRAAVVIADVQEARRYAFQCLGTTKYGWPQHPLYIPYHVAPMSYNPARL